MRGRSKTSHATAAAISLTETLRSLARRRIELAALDVVLVNAATQVGGDIRAGHEAQIAVRLFADEAAGARLRQCRILRLRHRHGSNVSANDGGNDQRDTK
jgi:hypothetical protein